MSTQLLTDNTRVTVTLSWHVFLAKSFFHEGIIIGGTEAVVPSLRTSTNNRVLPALGPTEILTYLVRGTSRSID